MSQPNNSYAPTFQRATYTFQPGGTAFGAIYTDWPTLYADLIKTAPGERSILFDGSFNAGTCTIPSGNWDMGGVAFLGNLPAGGTDVHCANGCKLPNLSSIDNGCHLIGSSTSAVIEVDSGSLTLFNIGFLSSIATDSTGDLLFLSNSTFMICVVNDVSNIAAAGSTGHPINIDDGSAIIYLGQGATCEDGSIAGSVSATVGGYLVVGSAEFQSTQPDFAGIVNTILADDSVKHKYETSLGVSNVNDALVELSSGAQTTQYIVPTNGGTGTINDENAVVILIPAGTIAGFTLTMPASPFNQQIVTIAGAGATITTLTLSPNSGQSFSTGAAITTLVLNTGARYSYRASNTTWYRVP